jgi:hypothetical protein
MPSIVSPMPRVTLRVMRLRIKRVSLGYGG